MITDPTSPLCIRMLVGSYYLLFENVHKREDFRLHNAILEATVRVIQYFTTAMIESRLNLLQEIGAIRLCHDQR